jgi:hypothetical protein
MKKRDYYRSICWKFYWNSQGGKKEKKKKKEEKKIKVNFEIPWLSLLKFFFFIFLKSFIL